MSIVVKHPSSYSPKEIFSFDDGEITIESFNSPVMAFKAIAWLEQVKFEILSALNQGI